MQYIISIYMYVCDLNILNVAFYKKNTHTYTQKDIYTSFIMTHATTIKTALCKCVPSRFTVTDIATYSHSIIPDINKDVRTTHSQVYKKERLLSDYCKKQTSDCASKSNHALTILSFLKEINAKNAHM